MANLLHSGYNNIRRNRIYIFVSNNSSNIVCCNKSTRCCSRKGAAPPRLPKHHSPSSQVSINNSTENSNSKNNNHLQQQPKYQRNINKRRVGTVNSYIACKCASSLFSAACCAAHKSWLPRRLRHLFTDSVPLCLLTAAV